MPSISTVESWLGALGATQERVGHWSAGGEQLYCAPLSFWGLFLCGFVLSFSITVIFQRFLLSLLLLLLNHSYLNPQVLPFFFFSCFCSLSHWERWGRWASCCMVLSCWLGLNHSSWQEIWFWVLPESLRTPFSNYFLWTPQFALFGFLIVENYDPHH